ncbi:MAG: hypothetical protein A2020_04600 [Lentisphaerae bacterium GWF2_45_14]|nr:MAG: hypothetical protein A2020_04600 [Lentisphaerae bacterium GWF2_45_14]
MEEIFRKSSCEICGSANLNEFASIGHRKIAACRKCGFVFSNEFNPLKVSEAYNAGPGPVKMSGLEKDARIRAELIKTLARCRELSINHKLLDVGAGTGEFIAALHAIYPALEIYSIQKTKSAQELIRDRIAPGALIGTDTDSLEHINKQFDIITMLQTLEHLNSPLKTLRTLYELLKPGGVLFITVPNINSYQVMLRGIDNNYCFSNETHLQFYSRKSLEAMLLKAGFKRKKRIIPGRCGNATGIGMAIQFALRILCISNELRYIAFK